MDTNLIKVKAFGQLRPETLYSKDVSLSFDTVQHSPTSEIKVLVQIEPSEVINTTNSIIQNKDNFDLILAWDERVLTECPNSKKFIFGTCWIDFDNLKLDKTNEISYIMSNKSFAPGHKLRNVIWNTYGNLNNINGFNFKRFKTPPRIQSKNILFENAKYHIVVENTSKKNWITEKLIDCFATKTIPIYWGCPNVGEFFNQKGILQFTNMEELGNILNTISSTYYDDMKEVIEENFEKSKEYYDFHKRVEKEINDIINV